MRERIVADDLGLNREEYYKTYHELLKQVAAQKPRSSDPSDMERHLEESIHVYMFIEPFTLRLVT